MSLKKSSLQETCPKSSTIDHLTSYPKPSHTLDFPPPSSPMDPPTKPTETKPFDPSDQADPSDQPDPSNQAYLPSLFSDFFPTRDKSSDSMPVVSLPVASASPGKMLGFDIDSIDVLYFDFAFHLCRLCIVFHLFHRIYWFVCRHWPAFDF